MFVISIVWIVFICPEQNLDLDLLKNLAKIKILGISELNQYWKFDEAPSIIYSDLESLIERIDGFKNIFENWSTTKVGEHFPCG